MSDPNLTPPLPDGEPTWTPPPAPTAPPAPPAGPQGAPPPGPPQHPQPGQWGAPPAAPGQWGAPTPGPGQPGAWDAPPPNSTWGVPGQATPGPPPPGGFQPGGYTPGYQPPALPYQPGYGIAGSAQLATPGKRIAGRVIDWLIMLVVLVPAYILVVAASSTTGSTTSSGEFGASDGIALGGLVLFMLLATVGQVLYEVGFVAIKGATPGKMLMKVRVVRESDGQIPGWGPAFMRWVPTLVGLVPCVGSFLSLGLWIWALVNLFNNDKRQTPFDLAAKTVVIDASQP